MERAFRSRRAFCTGTAPEALVMLAVYCIPIIVLYWAIRFAVKHGVKDALKGFDKDALNGPGKGVPKLFDKVDEK